LKYVESFKSFKVRWCLKYSISKASMFLFWFTSLAEPDVDVDADVGVDAFIAAALESIMVSLVEPLAAEGLEHLCWRERDVAKTIHSCCGLEY